MKKAISYLLIVCTLLLITGCNKEEPSSDNTPAPTTPSSNPEIITEPITLDVPFLAVGLPNISESTCADDGTEIYKESHPYMTLTLDGQVTADLIINDFMSKVDSSLSAAESLKAAAQSAYNGNSNFTPYQFSLNYTPTRIDTSVLSLFGSSVRYSGGSHPEHSCVAANYNIISGDPLTLGSIIKHQDSVDDLAKLLIKQLNVQKEEKFLRDGFEEDIMLRFSQDISFDSDWYFSKKGLCFYFAPYEIAPYSSGVIIAEIPYEELADILDPAFFPPESVENHGEITITPFSVDTANSFQQTSELILDEDGQKYFIFSSSCIENIQIVSRSTESANGDGETVYYTAYCLNPGNAIMLQANDASMYYVEYIQDGKPISIPIISK